MLALWPFWCAPGRADRQDRCLQALSTQLYRSSPRIFTARHRPPPAGLVAGARYALLWALLRLWSSLDTATALHKYHF